MPIRVNAEDFVLLLVADIEEVFAVPNGTFGEAESRCNGFELGVRGEQLGEFRRVGVQFKLALWLFALRKCCQRQAKEYRQHGPGLAFCRDGQSVLLRCAILWPKSTTAFSAGRYPSSSSSGDSFS